MATKDKKDSKEKIISSKFKSLESITKQFEDGKLDIDKGISEYKKAGKLIKDIRSELKGLELKIEEIRADYHD